MHVRSLALIAVALLATAVPAQAQLEAGAPAPVIAPDGKIAYTYTSLDPDRHVANLLAALRKLPGR